MDCTCGQYYGLESQQRQASASVAAGGMLDASFVHLHRDEDETSPRSSTAAKQDEAQGLLRSFQHLRSLEEALNDPGNPPPLCLDCVQRVERALDADTERLQNECRLYDDAIRVQDELVDGMERALRVAASASDSHGQAPNLQQTEESFRREIDQIESECKQYEAELRNLTALRRDQALVARQLNEIDYATEEEQISLNLDAQAFDNDQEQLYRSLVEIEAEIERLSSPRIRLPSLLIDLKVDRERGLRYPLINELRLAYRPKGDVQWNEVQAAWSLAAQLLLMIGTLFDFQSHNWKVVPLSRCAKVIYHPPNDSEQHQQGKKQVVVYNLGHPKTSGSRALIAWNALLYQVVQHTTSEMNRACESQVLDERNVPSLPFEISTGSIGGIVLSHLAEDDDGGWSRVIHYMASDLLWLSDCASLHILHQVLLTAATATE